ncbi:unnamed protein product [Arabidopsis halleri]
MEPNYEEDVFSASISHRNLRLLLNFLRLGCLSYLEISATTVFMFSPIESVL